MGSLVLIDNLLSLDVPPYIHFRMNVGVIDNFKNLVVSSYTPVFISISRLTILKCISMSRLTILKIQKCGAASAQPKILVENPL